MSQLKTLLIFPFIFAFIIVSVASGFNRNETVQAISHNELLVIVDAGHGGRDPGAVVNNVLEKEINLQVAKKVKSSLEKKGFRVILTRSGDSNLLEGENKDRFQQQDSLIKRVSIANSHKGALLVSIHVNASDDQNHFGPQTYYREGAIKGKELADSIQEELLKIRPSHRRAIVGDFYVLDNSELPAALIELGFITNEQERELLVKASFQQLQADAIVTGIIKYLKKE